MQRVDGASRKVFDCLRKAGASGCRTSELAQAVYGGSSNREKYRIAGLIVNLRFNHQCKIVSVRDGFDRRGRYVLEQKGQEPLAEILRLLTAALSETNHAYSSEQLATILTELLAAPRMKEKIAEALQPLIEAWLRDAA